MHNTIESSMKGGDEVKKTEEVLAIEKGHITESFAIDTQAIKDKGFFTVSEATGTKNKAALKPRIECIHSGMTRNKTFYPAEKLKGNPMDHSGVYSWTNPYPKPMLKNHDHTSEPTGRIENAMYVTNSVTGKESLVIIPTITDPDAIEKVMDGRYMTVSIGATTDAAICSICGTNLVEEGWCGHEKGEKYDGQECYWIVGNLFFDECSWVNVPADSDAQVIDKGEPVMMEAFAENDGVYYDLTKEQTDKDYILTEQVAKTYGLVTDSSPEGKNPGEKKEGTDDMTEEERLAQEAAAKAATEAASANPEGDPAPEGTKTEEGTEGTPTPSAADGTTEGAAEPTGTEESNGAPEGTEGTQEKAADQEEEKETDDVNALSEKVKELELRVSELEAENQTLLSSNTDLSAQLHKSLAERVVDLRISLGKPGTDDREAAIATYVSRSRESLEDSLADLQLEQQNVRGYIQQRADNTVTNPAGGAVGGEKHQTITTESKPAEQPKKELTELEVLTRLFGGRKTL
jgi:hypothetical protein